jgi:hypothetical protein
MKKFVYCLSTLLPFTDLFEMILKSEKHTARFQSGKLINSESEAENVVSKGENNIQANLICLTASSTCKLLFITRYTTYKH